MNNTDPGPSSPKQLATETAAIQPSSSAAANHDLILQTTCMQKVDIPSTPSLPPEHGPSLCYAQSSQARNWRFSAAQLAQLRLQGNTAARKRLERIWNQEKLERSDTAPTTTIPFLSVSDELSLLTYYLVKVGQIVRAFNLPELVEATATTYVKRFYLRNTCMDFHPKSIMTTCIFLASKTENYPLSLNQFATKLAGKDPKPESIRENETTVLDLEFLVSQSLDFEYSVHGAHRALYGLILDLQALPNPPSRDTIHELATASHKNLVNTRWTDAEFIYTPTQIALACLRAVRLGEQAQGQRLIQQWLDEKESQLGHWQKTTKLEREKIQTAERDRLNRAALAKTKGRAATVKHAEQQQEKPQDKVEDDLWIDSCHPFGLSRHQLDQILDDIEKLFHEKEAGGYTGLGKGSQEDIEMVKQIDKRQKECMNPEKVPGSKLYLKRQAEEEAVVAQKRAKKAAAAAVATAAMTDPFATDPCDSKRGGLFGQPDASQVQTKPAVEKIDSDDDDD